MLTVGRYLHCHCHVQIVSAWIVFTLALQQLTTSGRYVGYFFVIFFVKKVILLNGVNTIILLAIYF